MTAPLHSVDWLFASVAGAATASAAAAIIPPTTEPWVGVFVLGIPLGVLAAALFGSSARAFRDASQPEGTLPRRAVLTLFDGIIGGWLAMLLLGLKFTAHHFENVEPAILGGLGGLLVEYLRTNASRWVEQGVATFLAWIARKNPPGAP